MSLVGKPLSDSFQCVVTPAAMNPGNHKDPTNWSYTATNSRLFRGTMLHHNGANQYTNLLMGPFGTGSWDPGYPSWNRSFVYNKALEKLNSKLRGNLDLGVSLAESGQTLRMIRSIANLKRWALNPKNWSSKDIANGWLQWTYGWKPLLSDIYESADSTSRHVRKQLTEIVGSCTLPNRRSDQRNDYAIYVANPCSVVRRGDGKQSCRFVLTLEPRDGWDLGQWSSLNPVSLAWELIPYSFVVDWVWNVGSYLRNLETALLYGSYFVDGYVSELYVYEGVEEAVNKANGYLSGNGAANQAWTVSLGIKAKIHRVQFARTKLSSYPLPRLPTFKVALGSQRLFSAASLLRQLLK